MSNQRKVKMKFEFFASRPIVGVNVKDIDADTNMSKFEADFYSAFTSVLSQEILDSSSKKKVSTDDGR